jgi:hypothetical protein
MNEDEFYGNPAMESVRAAVLAGTDEASPVVRINVVSERLRRQP